MRKRMINHIQLHRNLFAKHVIFCVLMFLCISCGTDNSDELKPQDTTTQEETEREETERDNDKDDNTPDDAEEAIESQNLLTNGNLEVWKGTAMGVRNWATGWSMPNNEYVNRDNKIVYEGSYSAKLQSLEKGVTARIEQKISVNPGCKIRIIFHYYISQWQSKGARTYCYLRTASAEKYNISADDLKSFYGEKLFKVIRGGGYNLTYFPSNMNVWQIFDETIEVPPTATYFVFGINSYYGTTINVDDCYVMSNNPKLNDKQ